MANEQERLMPETIDEQLEALEERLRALPLEAPRTPEMRVVEALWDVYADERRADAGSLAETWNRLAARQEARMYAQQSALPPVPVRPEYERSLPMQIKKKIANWRERGFSRLAVAFTLVALVALMSGLFLGILLVRLPQQAAPVSVATPAPPTPFPSAPSVPTPFPTTTPAPTSPYLTNIQMVDGNTGWGVTSTGRVLSTTSGWAASRDVTPPGLGSPIAQVFLSAKVAWVASGTRADPTVSTTRPGDGTTILFRTTDGGATWQQSTLPFFLGQMTFVTSQDGWILVGRGAAAGSNGVDIYRTTDGGATWKLVSSANASSNPDDPHALPFSGSKSGMGFASATTGWVTGAEPAPDFIYLYKTTDGGQTWQHQDLPLPVGVSNTQIYVYPPFFADAQDGYMRVSFALDSGQVSNDLYVTHDGGKSWQSTTLLPATIYDFLDGRQGWATDGTQLWVTTNGAQDWTVLPQGNEFTSVSSLDFVSPTLGWALTAPIIGHIPNLLKTTDGGHTWEIVQTTLP